MDKSGFKYVQTNVRRKGMLRHGSCAMRYAVTKAALRNAACAVYHPQWQLRSSPGYLFVVLLLCQTEAALLQVLPPVTHESTDSTHVDQHVP